MYMILGLKLDIKNPLKPCLGPRFYKFCVRLFFDLSSVFVFKGTVCVDGAYTLVIWVSKTLIGRHCFALTGQRMP